MVKLANEEQSQVKRATRAAYGATLAELANEGLPVVAVDADLTGSTTTKKLADAGFADRLFNCGIAEQNMVDVAARPAAISPTPARSPCSERVAPTTRSATPCATATST